MELERADMPQAVAMVRTEAGALERQGVVSMFCWLKDRACAAAAATY